MSEKLSDKPQPEPPTAHILTPCIRVCTLDANQVCMGCHRTLTEIANWTRMTDAERLRIIERGQPQKP